MIGGKEPGKGGGKKIYLYEKGIWKGLTLREGLD